MTIQVVRGSLGYFPPFPNHHPTSNPASSGVITIDAASEKAAFIFRSSVQKSIRKVIFRTGTVTTGGADDLDIRIETVGTDGLPSGSLWDTNTNINHDLLDSNDNAWITSAALTADASINVGDHVAVVISNPAANQGTWNLTTNINVWANTAYGAAYVTSWSKVASPPLILVEMSDGSYWPIDGFFAGLLANTAFNSGSSTNERGNLFQVPFPVRAAGVWVSMTSAAGADYTINLYDSTGATTHATTGSIDSDFGQNALKFLAFNATYDLAANTDYILALVPGTANNNTLQGFSVPTAAAMDAFPLGQNCYAINKVSGTWTEDSTSRSLLGIYASGFGDDAGSGTTIAGTPMRRGMV